MGQGCLGYFFNVSLCVFFLQIETQLAEYHKLARKLKLIPKSAENSKGYDFEIKFNPEAGANCLVKYRAQVYVSNRECFKRLLSGMIDISFVYLVHDIWYHVCISKSLNCNISITQDILSQSLNCRNITPRLFLLHSSKNLSIVPYLWNFKAIFSSLPTLFNYPKKIQLHVKQTLVL